MGCCWYERRRDVGCCGVRVADLKVESEGFCRLGLGETEKEEKPSKSLVN